MKASIPARADRRGVVPPAVHGGGVDAELIPKLPEVLVVVGVVSVPARPIRHPKQHPAPLVGAALAAKLWGKRGIVC